MNCVIGIVACGSHTDVRRVCASCADENSRMAVGAMAAIVSESKRLVDDADERYAAAAVETADVKPRPRCGFVCPS